jgi:hypothetical protein
MRVMAAADSGMFLSTFGEDEDGNIYVADYGSGKIYEITSPSSRHNGILLAEPLSRFMKKRAVTYNFQSAVP